ncbi:MAG: hypothetical protein A3D44_02690 [Candidatus Staskawiczbacteria bacterium RIFCSPHIGHO2_02_FULL_42_22]|uniref:tRNA threonylcarbamoyladenosine biosynthesis protein TsaE n=1 Tax=Candidatus Staskawiczbacteria bacterium RIFCSPHIGHO2_02_FULL_42_22 TaxID=1802207 RepID=A0A1G2I3E0_9BACT|nr:MAG: hypothetical protein A3D44_02690 [Candidatus Staskawiczbacteria bacterium RIFCSPHIGHO2_02_FULL_42_22]
MEKIITKTFRQTQEVGQNFADEILSSDSQKTAVILALRGDLGAGKTTFLQGFAKGLGIIEVVNSPTFVIMKKFKIAELRGNLPFGLAQGGRGRDAETKPRGGPAGPPARPSLRAVPSGARRGPDEFIKINSYEDPRWQSHRDNPAFKFFYHFDLYRLESEKDLEFLNFQEIISNPKNIIAIEWPEKIGKLLPKNSISIIFKHLEENKRELIIHR